MQQRKLTKSTPAKEQVEAACREFLARAPIEQSTLTLDGTGVNGHIQFLILKTLGLEVIKNLKRVNLISGSWYTYCAFLAIGEGLVTDAPERMRRWDRDNRQHWHAASSWRVLKNSLAIARGQRPLFSNQSLETMLRATASHEFANRPISTLPANATTWLYDQTRRQLLPVQANSEFNQMSIGELARCCASIPRLYSAGMIQDRQVIDPVFSPQYKQLKRQLRAEASNHLIANIGLERTTKDTIWVKPHDFGQGLPMVFADFAKMVLNLPNPRIYQSWCAAYED